MAYLVIGYKNGNYLVVNPGSTGRIVLSERTLMDRVKTNNWEVMNFNYNGYSQGDKNKLPDIDDIMSGKQYIFILGKLKDSIDMCWVYDTGLNRIILMCPATLKIFYETGHLVNGTLRIDKVTHKYRVKLNRGRMRILNFGMIEDASSWEATAINLHDKQILEKYYD